VCPTFRGRPEFLTLATRLRFAASARELANFASKLVGLCAGFSEVTVAGLVAVSRSASALEVAASARCAPKVEHVFLMLKCQFGYRVSERLAVAWKVGRRRGERSRGRRTFSCARSIL